MPENPNIWLRRIVRVSLYGFATDCRVAAVDRSPAGRVFLHVRSLDGGDGRVVPADRVLWWTDLARSKGALA